MTHRFRSEGPLAGTGRGPVDVGPRRRILSLRCRWRDAPHEVELDFLAKDIYGGEVHPPVRKVTAFERFSDRV